MYWCYMHSTQGMHRIVWNNMLSLARRKVHTTVVENQEAQQIRLFVTMLCTISS